MSVTGGKEGTEWRGAPGDKFTCIILSGRGEILEILRGRTCWCGVGMDEGAKCWQDKWGSSCLVNVVMARRFKGESARVGKGVCLPSEGSC